MRQMLSWPMMIVAVRCAGELVGRLPDAVHPAVWIKDPLLLELISAMESAASAAVLSAPGVAGLLDFSRPVAVLALGILDIIPTPDGASLTAHYRDACCPGSALAVSNGAQLTLSEGQAAEIHALMANSSTPLGHWRTREEVAALLPGYTLLDPGVVPTAAWRPDEPLGDEESARSNAYAAVGILP